MLAYNSARCEVRKLHFTPRVASMRMNLPDSLRVGLLPILFFSFLHSTLAGIRPSFSLDYCSWHATDIVFVEATPTAGAFRVVESWKGDSETRSLVFIPELRPATGAMEIALPQDFESRAERTDTGTACWGTDGSLSGKDNRIVWQPMETGGPLRRNEDFYRLDRWRTHLRLPASDEPWTEHSRALAHESRAAWRSLAFFSTVK